MAQKKIRYAVVGLGNIAQVAVLPAFKNAKKNSELVALVSGDDEKLQTLGKEYGITNLYNYRDYDKCLQSGLIDAVYICTPNVHHRAFAEEAAAHGIHVLTEKPMAVTVPDCMGMIRAAEENDVKLMVAYRLHFDPANLAAIKTAQSGKIGDVRIFNSTFTFQITDQDNIRLKYDMGGGPLFDIGIYCINAARYIFQDEPVEVMAMALSNPRDPRFTEVEEMASVTLRYRGARIANFVISYGTDASASYCVIGTKGCLDLESAYEYTEEMTLTTTIKDKDTVRTFKKHDQFGPEIEYFSNCILKNITPEPSGIEGLNDIKILEAIFESARTKRMVKLDIARRDQQPSMSQARRMPAPRRTEAINAPSPHET
ncbi:Gfo/Idh/MocA family protein [Bdellovibrio sp. HCB274]|uniref:Gfo/Idh/MocA family protein n=1 Tax=Bdellovibrio sp. HCB274 TaxID=3394361 RepID=UPI0039B54F93